MHVIFFYGILFAQSMHVITVLFSNVLEFSFAFVTCFAALLHANFCTSFYSASLAITVRFSNVIEFSFAFVACFAALLHAKFLNLGFRKPIDVFNLVIFPLF